MAGDELNSRKIRPLTGEVTNTDYLVAMASVKG